MNQPNWTWAKKYNVGYLTITPGDWKAHSLHQIPVSRVNGGTGWVILDLDDTGRVMGIEVIQ